MEAQNVLEAKMDKIQAERTVAAIKENAAEIFRPAGSPVAGNPKGDVTVIEFFDYNCGYCKKAFTDLAQLVDKDKKVKVILREFPILNKGSEETSRVALAAKMQGKYWEFHRAMLESQGQASEASAVRVAEKVGLDIARLKKDMASPEVNKEITDTRNLAAKLGIQGTPHFLVGDRIIPGAPENLYEQMSKLVMEVRKEGCKVC
jgi:protein-disulfide isomerase